MPESHNASAYLCCDARVCCFASRKFLSLHWFETFKPFALVLASSSVLTVTVTRSSTPLVQSLLDLDEAIRMITRVVDERMEQPASERKDRVAIPASVLELAGAQELVPATLRTSSGRRYGDYTPGALQGGTGDAQAGLRI